MVAAAWTDHLWALGLAMIPVVVAVWLSRRATKRDLERSEKASGEALRSIEVKVDGRLEAALERIDKLEHEKSVATGEPAPPLVAGLNVPETLK